MDHIKISCLNQHVVPDRHLEVGETVFDIIMDFEESKPAKGKGKDTKHVKHHQEQQTQQNDCVNIDFTGIVHDKFISSLQASIDKKKESIMTYDHMFIIMVALLNTNGGLIRIAPSVFDKFDDGIFDKWRNKMNDYLEKFLPAYIMKKCISVEKTGKHVYVMVHKAKEFITKTSHLYTRVLGSNSIAKYSESIITVFNQTETSTTQEVLNKDHRYRYNSKFARTEKDNMEFKCFDCTTIKDMSRRLDKERIKSALCAMGNIPSGGDIILGINDKNIIIGQVLKRNDEEEFKKTLQRILQYNSDDRSRTLWGDLDSHPMEGSHWTCQFYPVKDHPGCSCIDECFESSHTRRVLIHIHINYCPRGVYVKQPESYAIMDNGQIAQVEFPDWLDKHYKPQQADMKKAQSIEIFPKQKKESVKQSKTSSTVKPELYDLDDNALVTYREHSTYWDQDKNSHTNIDCCLPNPEKCELFKMHDNFNITLNVSRLSRPPISSAQIAEMHRRIQMKTSKKAFGIQLTEINLSQTESESMTNHLLDAVVVDKNSSVFLFGIFTTSGSLEEKTKQKAYTMRLGKTLKKHILDGMDDRSNLTSIYVHCIVLWMEDHSEYTSPDFYLKMQQPPVKTNIKPICNALYKMYSKAGQFKNMFGQDIIVQYSSQQVETLFNICTDVNRINIIEGPPGSGKTLLALQLCKMKGKHRSAYFCSSKAVVNFINHQENAEAFLVKDGNDVLKLVSGFLENREHFILDDSHNILSDKTTWKVIIQTIRKRETTAYLYIFQDSKFQHFEINKGKRMQMSFDQYLSTSKTDCFRKSMSVIHRNSQVVASYIKQSTLDTPLSSKYDAVTVQNITGGDDLCLRHIVHMAVEDEDNGLLQHVKSLTLSEEPYELSDMAILLDHKSEEYVLMKIAFFTKLFNTHWPESKVQTCDRFPVQGLTIDSLDNFVGLERRLVLFVVPNDHRSEDMKTGRTVLNPKYKVAVASRGIDRVEFLFEETVDSVTAYQMKFDQLDELRRISNETKEIKRQMYTNADDETWTIKMRYSDDSDKSRTSDESSRRIGIYDNEDFMRSSRQLDSRSRHLQTIKKAIADPPIEEYENVATLPRSGSGLKMDKAKLMTAVKKGQTDVVNKLIGKGYNLNELDDDGWSPLAMAAASGHHKLVTLLVSAGADPYRGKQTALGAAAEAGQAETVRFLLGKKFNVNTLDGDMMSPVAWASYYNHIEIIQFLLSAGADPNVGIRTALGAAAGNGHLTTVTQLLLNQCCDVNVVDEDKWTALSWACLGGHTQVAQMMFKFGADPSLGKFTALAAAIQGGHLNTVKFLLYQGVDVYAKDGFGKSAIDRAKEKRHKAINEYIRQHIKQLTVTSPGGT